MSQQDVIDWLRAHHGPHTVREVAAGLEVMPQTAQKYIHKLYRWGDVQKVGEINNGINGGMRYLYMLSEDLPRGKAGWIIDSIRELDEPEER